MQLDSKRQSGYDGDFETGYRRGREPTGTFEPASQLASTPASPPMSLTKFVLSVCRMAAATTNLEE